MLFEPGLCAIKDKYYQESCLSITASLERFYEFFIRIIIKANGLPNNIFDKIYKNMANQSERQFGAFICAYSLAYKEETPILLNRKYVEFRNKIVHKGFLPSEMEIKEYAEDVFNVIKFYYSKIISDYNDIINQY